MKQDIQPYHAGCSKAFVPYFYSLLLKFLEVGMDWDFRRLGVYPMEKEEYSVSAHR